MQGLSCLTESKWAGSDFQKGLTQEFHSGEKVTLLGLKEAWPSRNYELFKRNIYTREEEYSKEKPKDIVKKSINIFIWLNLSSTNRKIQQAKGFYRLTHYRLFILTWGSCEIDFFPVTLYKISVSFPFLLILREY